MTGVPGSDPYPRLRRQASAHDPLRTAEFRSRLLVIHPWVRRSPRGTHGHIIVNPPSWNRVDGAWSLLGGFFLGGKLYMKALTRAGCRLRSLRSGVHCKVLEMSL